MVSVHNLDNVTTYQVQIICLFSTEIILSLQEQTHCTVHQPRSELRSALFTAVHCNLKKINFLHLSVVQAIYPDGG